MHKNPLSLKITSAVSVNELKQTNPCEGLLGVKLVNVVIVTNAINN